ncbi:MAG: glycosyltransferase [Parcubacteria group bacterium]|nr:glycosyltransferase [Parcubacteria group bacterium]
MNIRIIGNTQDPWALAVQASIPQKVTVRTVLLKGVRPQIFATFFFWLARFRVLWLGSHETYGTLVKPFIRLASGLSHAILAPNQAIETQYLKAGVTGKKLSLIYPPCEPDASRAPKNDQTFTIACDGETDIEHGLGIVMRAIRDSQDILGNVRLVIGGTIKDRGRIEWLAQELGLKHSLKLVPAKGYDWIAPGDVFLFMRNHNAPVPVSLAYALASGKPIISNDALTHREFIQHHKNGILLKDANSDMLSQALINLSRKPEWLAELGHESARFAEKRFAPELVQKKMRAVFL